MSVLRHIYRLFTGKITCPLCKGVCRDRFGWWICDDFDCGWGRRRR